MFFFKYYFNILINKERHVTLKCLCIIDINEERAKLNNRRLELAQVKLRLLLKQDIENIFYGKYKNRSRSILKCQMRSD